MKKVLFGLVGLVGLTGVTEELSGQIFAHMSIIA
jgi:hypothetical protein